MDSLQDQFFRLRKQWSDYTLLDDKYNLVHDKNLVATVGVAWVVKISGADYEKPVGWEVEIIDTPLGISERCHNLLRWLKNPPPQFYDRLYSHPDFFNRIYTKYKEINSLREKKIEYIPRIYEPTVNFSIPPNEYEIFKKSCCQCKEKSFKNTSTNCDPHIVKDIKEIYKTKKILGPPQKTLLSKLKDYVEETLVENLEIKDEREIAQYPLNDMEPSTSKYHKNRIFDTITPPLEGDFQRQNEIFSKESITEIGKNLQKRSEHKNYHPERNAQHTSPIYGRRNETNINETKHKHMPSGDKSKLHSYDKNSDKDYYSEKNRRHGNHLNDESIFKNDVENGKKYIPPRHHHDNNSSSRHGDRENGTKSNEQQIASLDYNSYNPPDERKYDHHNHARTPTNKNKQHNRDISTPRNYHKSNGQRSPSSDDDKSFNLQTRWSDHHHHNNHHHDKDRHDEGKTKVAMPRSNNKLDVQTRRSDHHHHQHHHDEDSHDKGSMKVSTPRSNNKLDVQTRRSDHHHHHRDENSQDEGSMKVAMPRSKLDVQTRRSDHHRHHHHDEDSLDGGSMKVAMPQSSNKLDIPSIDYDSFFSASEYLNRKKPLQSDNTTSHHNKNNRSKDISTSQNGVKSNEANVPENLGLMLMDILRNIEPYNSKINHENEEVPVSQNGNQLKEQRVSPLHNNNNTNRGNNNTFHGTTNHNKDNGRFSRHQNNSRRASIGEYRKADRNNRLRSNNHIINHENSYINYPDEDLMSYINYVPSEENEKFPEKHKSTCAKPKRIEIIKKP